MAEREGATLVVSRLDRLGRHPRFLEEVISRKLDFRALNIPQLTLDGATSQMILGVLMLVARFELTQIRERTAAALQEKKARGFKLGGRNPKVRAGLKKPRTGKYKAHRKRIADNFASEIGMEISSLRERGMSYHSIAKHFRISRKKTARGGKWESATVRNIFLRFQRLSKGP